MKSHVFWAVCALTIAAQSATDAQTITLTTEPATAKMYMVENGVRSMIGVGSARIKLQKESSNEVTTEADGYKTRVDRFEKGGKYPKGVVLTLKTRVVKLATLPYDAKIYLNGTGVGTQRADIEIPEGVSATVELKKVGFKTITRVYHNRAGADVPPIHENLELADLSVAVETIPAGATIFVDNQSLGETTADVTVPRGKCVSVKAVLTGYKPVEHPAYCNKEQADPPKLRDQFVMRDRMTVIHATPASAAIKVNGKFVGNGEFPVTVANEACATVEITADGYVDVQKNFCNEANSPPMLPDISIQLVPDEAFNSATVSDQANVNFTIEVNPLKAQDDAWRLVSQIVTNRFDVLEITDKETGYLRTAWQIAAFPNSTIRTRVIVKLGDTKPLKYVVKVASERAPGRVSVKEDEKFREWGWILNSYKDIVNELQSRLR